MAFLIGGANSAADGVFSVANSCRFNAADGAYMSQTWGSSGNRRTWTLSMWVKFGETPQSGRLFSIGDDVSNTIMSVFFTSGDFRVEDAQGGDHTLNFRTNAIYRDPSAWQHFAIICDTTQGTDTNRVKIYHNGTQVTSFSETTLPDQNLETLVNHTTGAATIGATAVSQSGSEFDGYMAEVVMLDGTAAAITDLGEFDEDSPTIWKPKDVSGLSFGTNGFYLDFEDSSNLGNDANGGTDFAETNLAAADQATDTPTNNFATFNSLSKNDSGTRTFSEGNLYTAHSGSDSKFCSYSTIGVASGKWYGEFKFVASSGGTDYEVGVGYDVEDANRLGKEFGYTAGTYGYNAYGNKHENSNETSYGDTLAVGDIVGVFLDLDNHELYFSKNGTVQASGDPTSGASGTNAAFSLATGQTYFMGASHATATTRTTDYAGNYGGCPAFAISSGNADANGYGNFEYDPQGYYALCTKNLAEFG